MLSPSFYRSLFSLFSVFISVFPFIMSFLIFPTFFIDLVFSPPYVISFLVVLCSLCLPFLFLCLSFIACFILILLTLSVHFLLPPLYYLLPFVVLCSLYSPFLLLYLFQYFSHFPNSFNLFHIFLLLTLLSPSLCRSLFSLFPIFISLSLSRVPVLGD